MSKYVLQVSHREHTQILAALRLWQDRYDGGPEFENTYGSEPGGLMSDEEIDVLAESINCNSLSQVRVAILVEEGCVRDVRSDLPIEALVLDFDTDGSDLEDEEIIKKVPGSDGKLTHAWTNTKIPVRRPQRSWLNRVWRIVFGDKRAARRSRTRRTQSAGVAS